MLQAFGPCPLITEKVDPNITNDQIPGRSHFDYCVDYIVGKLDDAANVLPATRATEDLGRATSTICKCLKARVLLYAASPLWMVLSLSRTGRMRIMKHRIMAKNWSATLTTVKNGTVH